MDFQPLNEAEVKRIEESVQKGSAKIAELGGWLANGESFTTWATPLPDISSHFKDAQSALNELCDAHRQAVKSVKAQENEVQQQNKKRADEPRAETEDLERRVAKLERKQRKLDEKEEKQKQKDEEQRTKDVEQAMKGVEQKTKDGELERRFRELAESQSTLDRSKEAHWTEKGRVAGVESNLKTAQAEIREAEERLWKEQYAHDATKESLEKAQQRSRDIQTQGDRQLEAQREAQVSAKRLADIDRAAWDREHAAVVAFLEHVSVSLTQGSSLVATPNAQELMNLHKKCLEATAPVDTLPLRLPPIVIAAGHLRAPWSYLSLASAGFQMDSRFNRTITPSAALDLPWVLDALDRVIRIVSDEPIPAAVLVVLLQGIAWVHLASKMTSVTWRTTPHGMLDTLSVRFPSEHTVLDAILSQARDLVLDYPVSSWIADELSTEKRVDSSNSALPPGVSLARSSGLLFLAWNTVNEQQLFVMDLGAVKCFTPRMGYAFIQLPHVEGLPTELRRMDILNSFDHHEVYEWILDML